MAAEYGAGGIEGGLEAVMGGWAGIGVMESGWVEGGLLGR